MIYSCLSIGTSAVRVKAVLYKNEKTLIIHNSYISNQWRFECWIENIFSFFSQ